MGPNNEVYLSKKLHSEAQQRGLFIEWDATYFNVYNRVCQSPHSLFIYGWSMYSGLTPSTLEWYLLISTNEWMHENWFKQELVIKSCFFNASYDMMLFEIRYFILEITPK